MGGKRHDRLGIGRARAAPIASGDKRALQLIARRGFSVALTARYRHAGIGSQYPANDHADWNLL